MKTKADIPEKVPKEAMRNTRTQPSLMWCALEGYNRLVRLARVADMRGPSDSCKSQEEFVGDKRFDQLQRLKLR